MFEYKLLSSPHQQELLGTINQLAENAGWHLKGTIRPPSQRKGPRSLFYATMERRLLRLEWSQSIDTDTAGYKIYVSKTPENGIERKWAELGIVQKDVRNYDVPISLYAQPGIEYAFSVSAFDLAGNESKRSIVATVQR